MGKRKKTKQALLFPGKLGVSNRCKHVLCCAALVRPFSCLIHSLNWSISLFFTSYPLCAAKERNKSRRKCGLGSGWTQVVPQWDETRHSPSSPTLSPILWYAPQKQQTTPHAGSFKSSSPLCAENYSSLVTIDIHTSRFRPITPP